MNRDSLDDVQATIDAAMDEAFSIAAGLPRAEVEQRARQVFDAANDIRARYRSPLDIARRGQWMFRAAGWADVLVHMDATGEAVFCGCDCGCCQCECHGACDESCTPTPSLSRRLRNGFWDLLAGLWSLLDVAGRIQSYRDVMGARPIVFYQWPEEAARHLAPAPPPATTATGHEAQEPPDDAT